MSGCTAQKAVNSITRENANRLRDSAYKYAWAVRDKEKAAVYYDSLFMSGYQIKKDYYNAGQVAAEMGLYTKCIAVWSKMLKVKNDDEYDYNYYLPGMVGPQFYYYEGLINAKGFKSLWSHYKNYPLDSRLSHKDSLLAKKIGQMFITDQTVRYDYRDTPTVKNSYLWIRCDSINAKSVDSIIANRGIIRTKEFGYKVARDFSILFVHLPDSLIKRYMSLIEITLKNKDISEACYALIKDRSLVYEKKGQLYGTQLYLDTATKKNIFFSIQNIENIDRRRKKMGLTKLTYYAKQNNALLPKGYQQ